MDVKRSLGNTAVRVEGILDDSPSACQQHADLAELGALRNQQTQEPRAGSAGGMTWDHPYLADLLLGGQEPPALGPSLEMDGLGLR